MVSQDVLFLNEELCYWLFDNLEEPSVNVKHSKERELKGGIDIKSQVSIFKAIKLALAGWLSFGNKDKEEHEFNLLHLFKRLYSSPILMDQIPNYKSVRPQKDRIVKMKGLVSWRKFDGPTWEGDLVIYETPQADEPVFQIILNFSAPLSPDLVPPGVHGLEASVLTKWDPYFEIPRSKDFSRCSVIAIIND